MAQGVIYRLLVPALGAFALRMEGTLRTGPKARRVTPAELPWATTVVGMNVRRRWLRGPRPSRPRGAFLRAPPGVEKPGAHRGDIVARVGADETDAKYYERVEVLAKRVCSLALDEGWLTYLPEDEDQTPLQQAVNEMARHLRHIHQHDDGCLGH